MAAEAIADAGIEGAELEAIGITNQRETVVAWDPDSGEPIHRALVWQDRRTAERCEELRARGPRGPRPRADRPRPRPLLLGDEDRVAAAQRRGRRARRLRHGRLLAPVQADRPPRDRPHQRIADDAVRHPPPRLGRGALRDARRRPGARCPSRFRPRRSSGRRPSSAARSRSPGSPATSRRRCSARPATPPGPRRTPTAPAASSSSTPGRGPRPGRGPALHRRLRDAAASPPTRSRPRSSSPAPRCSGCATGSGSSTRPARPRRWRPRSRATTASTSSRR